MQHPIPFKKFASTLVKTPDEVWTNLLARLYGTEKHTQAEWMALLDKLRKQPA